MACERWCFNRGCDGATRRWPYALLLALAALATALAEHEHDMSRYVYGDVLARGRTSADYRPSDFTLLSYRERRATGEKTVVTTEQPAQEQHHQMQQQQQQQQQQPDVNTSNASVNVPYSTVLGATEVHDQPTPSSNQSATAKLDVARTNKTAVIVSQPMNPSTVEPISPSVWLNRTMWPNVTEKVADGKKTTKTGEIFSAGEDADEKDKPDSDIGDINKFSNLSNKTLKQHNITNTLYDTHQYYNSTFIVDEATAKKYWVDMDNHPELKINRLLSESHQRATTVKLKFDFPFYGHKVRNITIATGGFLYTGEYVHSWLAATQYIAPLMANFDTRLSNDSYVRYADNGSSFTVEWEKVVLQNKTEAGAFTFQVTLYQNGDIVFVYSDIPLTVENIQDSAHPVKIGLSDAYIMDRIVFFIRRKTIYEYHHVNLTKHDIKNWTAIYLRALPTCLEMDNCRDCLTKLKDFNCTWCSELNRCSTGTFRARQDWLLKGCDVRKIKDVDKCPLPTQVYKEHEEFSHDTQVHSNKPIAVDDMSVKQERPDTSPLERPRDNMHMGVSGVIGTLLIVSLVVGLVVWVTYAYRNPHSASGQMLIRYRPSQWSWRRGEARYTAATIHM